MSNNIDPPYAGTPVIGVASLTSATPITSRANITGTTGLVQLTATSPNGNPVSSIRVKAKGTSVQSNLFIWMYNGTTSFIFDEIDIVANTAANTADSISTIRLYPDLVIPATFQLYVSQTVSTDLNVYAMGGNY